MKIAIDETKDYKPVNVTNPYNVPVHCREAVHEQLLANIRMRIIEPVPVDDTSRWCGPMMTVMKSNSDPRMVTNFQGQTDAANGPRTPHRTPSDRS